MRIAKHWLVSARRGSEKVKFEISGDGSYSAERIIEILNEACFPMTNFKLKFIKEVEKDY